MTGLRANSAKIKAWLKISGVWQGEAQLCEVPEKINPVHIELPICALQGEGAKEILKTKSRKRSNNFFFI